LQGKGSTAGAMMHAMQCTTPAVIILYVIARSQLLQTRIGYVQQFDDDGASAEIITGPAALPATPAPLYTSSADDNDILLYFCFLHHQKDELWQRQQAEAAALREAARLNGAARTIQDAWRRFSSKRIFRYYRDLIRFREAGRHLYACSAGLASTLRAYWLRLHHTFIFAAET
jgi:hypothetical protein